MSSSYVEYTEIPLSPSQLEMPSKLLQTAFAEGRLSLAEFETRMGDLLRAKNQKDIHALIVDLFPAAPHGPNRSSIERSLAIFSGIEQKGSFLLPAHLEISAIFGGYVLDLSNAQFSSHHSFIDIKAIFGGVVIVAPKGVRILVKGFPIFGGISNRTRDESITKSAATIEINARCIFGGIEIDYRKEKSLTYSW